MHKTTRSLLTATASLACWQAADAAATRIAYVDAFATARGNAFTATADNPSAVFYNAAGLTQLEGSQVQANMYAISLGYEFEGALGSEDMDDDYQVVPSFFASHSFADSNFAIGFGTYAPFALGSDWGDSAIFAPFGYKAELKYVKYHGVIAWQVTDTLSIAAGLSVDNADIELDTTALGSFEGDDQTTGLSFSVLWQPNEEHSFGLNYQAATSMNFEGNWTALAPLPTDATARLQFPESIVVGYSWRPTENWNLEVNVDWTNWDKVNDLTISGSFVPFSQAIPLNWESSFIWEAGVTRYLGNGLHISAGYTFVENAIPDADFLPIVPDADRHFLSIGLGGEHNGFTWQVAYQIAIADERSVTDGNDLADVGPPFGNLVDGAYDLDSQAFAVSVGYKF